MLIGFLGTIPFATSSRSVRTFDEYQRSGSGRWSKHDLVNQKPALEFLGPDTDKISFKMLLRADLGINPANELERLRRLRDSGTVLPLMIGFKSIGRHFWVIDSLDYTVKHWTRFGQLYSVEVTVTLQEYVDGVVRMYG